MSRQQTNREVAAAAQIYNNTYRKLRSELRAQGIRNVHTSPKAQAAIRRASRPDYDVRGR